MAPEPLILLVPTAEDNMGKWCLAVASVAAEVRLLSQCDLITLAGLVDDVHSCKLALHAIVEAVDVGSICAQCGGDCCRTGKYHFTVVDLLVYLLKEKELFTPRFDRDLCPYLGQTGCLMPPGFRPFTCVIFNCEKVDDLLDEPQRKDLHCLEGKLRELYGRVEELLQGRFMAGLLMNCERDLIRNGSTILRNRKSTGGFNGRD